MEVLGGLLCIGGLVVIAGIALLISSSPHRTHKLYAKDNDLFVMYMIDEWMETENQ